MKLTKPVTNRIIFLLLFFIAGLTASGRKADFVLSLNGPWEMGSGRNYDYEVTVPGIHTDAEKMNIHSAPWRLCGEKSSFVYLRICGKK